MGKGGYGEQRGGGRGGFRGGKAKKICCAHMSGNIKKRSFFLTFLTLGRGGGRGGFGGGGFNQGPPSEVVGKLYSLIVGNEC